jgi:hypothetical protein
MFVRPQIVPGARGYAGIQVSYDEKTEIFSPEQIVGALFQKLKAVAEGGLEGTKVSQKTTCHGALPP